MANIEQRARGFSLVKAILHRLGEDVDVGFEREISERGPAPLRPNFAGIAVPDEYFLERRVIDIRPGASPDAIAGPLYPTTLRPDLFVDRLRSALVVQRLGATVLDGLVGTIDIPRQVKLEHRAARRRRRRIDPHRSRLRRRDADPENGRRDDHLHAGARCSTRCRSIEGIVRNDLAAIVAAAIDIQALFGDGSGNTPTGVRNTTGVHDLSMISPPASITPAAATCGSAGGRCRASTALIA